MRPLVKYLHNQWLLGKIDYDYLLGLLDKQKITSDELSEITQD